VKRPHKIPSFVTGDAYYSLSSETGLVPTLGPLISKAKPHIKLILQHMPISSLEAVKGDSIDFDKVTLVTIQGVVKDVVFTSFNLTKVSHMHQSFMHDRSTEKQISQRHALKN
jgi:hypothetical protein